MARFIELGLSLRDKVLIEKAGDIIPQVVRPTWRPLTTPKMEIPKTCPCCDSPATADGAHLWCQNVSCPSQLERRVLYWLREVDVKGAGPGIVKQMCESGIVTEVSDLYYLTSEALTDAIGSQSIADKILREIALKSEMPLSRFLTALGIHCLGHSVGKALAKKYGTLDEVLGATTAELESMEGIGSTIAQQVMEGLKRMGSEIESLQRAIELEAPAAGGALTGMSFCLTGAMSRKRNEIAADIEAAGGDVKSSVGKGLTFLVQADPTSESGKTKKAAACGTKVISEEALMEMMA